MRLARIVVRGVRDAEAAAQIDLGQLDAVLVAYLGQQLHHPAGRDLESRHIENLRPDVAVNSDELQAIQLQRTAHGLRRLSAGQRDTELLVLVRGRDEFMGMRLDTDRDPDLHPLPLAEPLRDMRDPHHFLERVEHDPPDARLHGPGDFLGALVVPVQRDPLGRHSGRQRRGQLAPGTDIEVQPLLMQPPHNGPGQKSLPGVEHIGVRAESVLPGPAARPEIVLVQEIRRGTEFLGERGDIQPADGDHTVGVAPDRTGPHPRVEGVQVGGRPGVMPFGQHIGVPGPCGVRGTAHDSGDPLKIVQRCSGAEMPSRHRPLASTVRPASARASRARCTAKGFCSPTGSGG